MARGGRRKDNEWHHENISYTYQILTIKSFFSVKASCTFINFRKCVWNVFNRKNCNYLWDVVTTKTKHIKNTHHHGCTLGPTMEGGDGPLKLIKMQSMCKNVNTHMHYI